MSPRICRFAICGFKNHKLACPPLPLLIKPKRMTCKSDTFFPTAVKTAFANCKNGLRKRGEMNGRTGSGGWAFLFYIYLCKAGRGNSEGASGLAIKGGGNINSRGALCMLPPAVLSFSRPNQNFPAPPTTCKLKWLMEVGCGGGGVKCM
jgi:hypothetical protein